MKALKNKLEEYLKKQPHAILSAILIGIAIIAVIVALKAPPIIQIAFIAYFGLP